MKNIRIYGKDFSPEIFKHRGIRGIVVRLLNWVRYQAELRCQIHAMLILGPLAESEIAKYGTPIHRPDPTIEHLASYEENKPAKILSGPDQTVKALARYTAGSRSKRYARARHTRALYIADGVTDDIQTAKNTGNDSGN